MTGSQKMSLKARAIRPVTTLAAAAMLAACGGNEAAPAPVSLPTSTSVAAPALTPTPAPTATYQPTTVSTQTEPVAGQGSTLERLKSNPIFYLSAACRDKGNSSIVDFAIGEIGIGTPKPVIFDAASGIERVFGNYYADPAHKSNFVCRNVVMAGQYLVVVASDGKQTNYPPSIVHVLKVERPESGGVSLGYVGSWSNLGHQGYTPEKVQVVKDYEGLDLLVMGSLVNRGTGQSNAIFSALENSRGQYNGNYLAQVTAHALGQSVPFNPDQFSLNSLTLKALRPVFPASLSGIDPQVEKILVTGQEGKGFMAVIASEDVSGVRNYAAAAGFVPLGGADGFITQGVKPGEPLSLN